MRTLIFGHVYVSGIYPDGASANPAQMARIKHAIGLHKTFIRPFLPTSRLYHHQPVLRGREPSGWCAWEAVAADRARVAVAVFRLAGPADPEYRLRLRGVDVSRRYQVTFDNTGDTAEITGLALAQEGILVRLPRPLSSELLLLTRLGL